MSILFSRESYLFSVLKRINNSETKSITLGKAGSFTEAVRLAGTISCGLKLEAYGLVTSSRDGNLRTFTITDDGRKVAEKADGEELWEDFAEGFKPFKPITFEGLSPFESEVLLLVMRNKKIYLDELSASYVSNFQKRNVYFGEKDRIEGVIKSVLERLKKKSFVTIIKNNRYRICHNLLVHDEEMKALQAVRNKTGVLTEKEQKLLKRAKRVEALWEDLSYLYAYEDKSAHDGTLVIEDEQVALEFLDKRKIERVHYDTVKICQEKLPESYSELMKECREESFFLWAAEKFMKENQNARKINLYVAILKCDEVQEVFLTSDQAIL